MGGEDDERKEKDREGDKKGRRTWRQVEIEWKGREKQDRGRQGGDTPKEIKQRKRNK